MSTIDVRSLLAPIGEDNPCGEDLSDLTEYYVLEDLIAGTSPGGESEAGEPDWARARDTAVDLLQQGKELRVVVHLIHALVRLEGFPGLRDGLQLLHGMLDVFWDDLYPTLEEDVDNPAEARMNILKELSSGAAEGETISPVVMAIREARLCTSRQMGSFCWRDVLMAEGELPVPEDHTAPDTSVIHATVADADPEVMEETIGAIDEAIQCARQIEELLNEKAGTDNTAGFNKLAQLLTQMKQRLADSPQIDTSDALDQNGTPENAGKPPPATRGFSGDISSQADVIKAIDAICRWYDANEKSSPVPLFLKRAKRLVGQDFMTIVQDVARNAESDVRDLFRTDDEEE